MPIISHWKTLCLSPFAHLGKAVASLRAEAGRWLRLENSLVRLRVSTSCLRAHTLAVLLSPLRLRCLPRSRLREPRVCAAAAQQREWQQQRQRRARWHVVCFIPDRTARPRRLAAARPPSWRDRCSSCCCCISELERRQWQGDCALYADANLQQRIECWRCLGCTIQALVCGRRPQQAAAHRDQYASCCSTHPGRLSLIARRQLATDQRRARGGRILRRPPPPQDQHALRRTVQQP